MTDVPETGAGKNGVDLGFLGAGFWSVCHGYYTDYFSITSLRYVSRLSTLRHSTVDTVSSCIEEG